MQGEEVGNRVHVLGCLGAFGSELPESLGGHVGIVGDDAHPEPESPPRHLLADSAEAEHAERLACELDPAVRASFPAALLQRGMGLRDVARKGDEEADRVLRGGDDRGVWRVGDDDPAARGRLDVDVVDPDSGPSDHLQPLGTLDQLGGQLRGRADDDRVVAADDLLERALGIDVHVEA